MLELIVIFLVFASLSFAALKLYRERKTVLNQLAEAEGTIRQLTETNDKQIQANKMLLTTYLALSRSNADLNQQIKNAHANLERVLMYHPPSGQFDEIGVEVGRAGMYYTFSKKELSRN